MIRSFKDRGTRDLFDGADTARAHRSCPKALWPVARRKLDQLNQVGDVRELLIPPGNRLEALAGEQSGRCSLRVNEQCRICFVWKNEHAEAVEVSDYHR
jgi:proteic killer suppression protein